jgi:hypothetical protein
MRHPKYELKAYLLLNGKPATKEEIVAAIKVKQLKELKKKHKSG